MLDLVQIAALLELGRLGVNLSVWGETITRKVASGRRCQMWLRHPECKASAIVLDTAKLHRDVEAKIREHFGTEAGSM